MDRQGIQSLFDSLKGTELQQESFHEDMTWDQYVQEQAKAVEDDARLKELLLIRAQEEATNEITLERLMTSNFFAAKDAIDQMTLAKRISILEDLNQYRDYLYECIDRYGKEGLSKDEQLTANEFRILMGRLKHLEIMQNWLYGIV